MDSRSHRATGCGFYSTWNSKVTEVYLLGEAISSCLGFRNTTDGAAGRVGKQGKQGDQVEGYYRVADAM